MAARVAMLDKPRGAGGKVQHFLPFFPGGVVPGRIDRKTEFSFDVPNDHPALTYATPFKTYVEVELEEHGISSEWRFVKKERKSGSERAKIFLEPVFTVLATVGPIHWVESAGAALRYALSGRGLTFQQWVEGIIVPFLEDKGIEFFRFGASTDTRAWTITFDKWPPLRLLEELEKLSGKELYFSLAEDGFWEINLGRVGAGTPTVGLYARKNLEQLAEVTHGDGFANVIGAWGRKFDGSPERHSIARMQYVVASAPSGDFVPVVDPLGGPGPIAVDGQWAGPSTYKLISPAGDSWEIVGSIAATQTFELAAGGGADFSEDDVVQLRVVRGGVDSPIEEVEDPDSAADNRSVAAPILIEDMRGEAALSNNWWARNWTTKPTQQPCRIKVSLSAAGTTASLKGLPAGYAIADGDTLKIWGTTAGSGIGVKLVRRIVGAAIADGSGEVVVTLSSALPNPVDVADDSDCCIYKTVLPNGWTDLNAGVESDAATVMYRPGNAQLANVDCFASGAVDRQRIPLKGLGAGQILWPGDVVRHEVGDKPWGIVAAKVVADGSGNATVLTTGRRDWSGASVANDSPMRVIRPSLLAESPVNVAVVTDIGVDDTQSSTGKAEVRLPDATAYPLVDSLTWLRADLVVRTAGPTNKPYVTTYLNGGADQSSASDALGTSSVYTGDPDDRLLTIAVAVDASDGDDVGAKVTVGDTANGEVFAFVSGVSAMMGSEDPAIPLLEQGSYANELVDQANQALLVKRTVPRSITVLGSERVEQFQAVPPEAPIVLGGEALVRHVDAEPVVFETLRFVEVAYSMDDEAITKVVLATRLDEASTLLVRSLQKATEQREVEGALWIGPEDLAA